MRLLNGNTLAAVLVLVPSALSPELLAVLPQSRLWVEGTSTIRSFECKVPDFTLTVATDGAAPVAAVLAGQKAVRALELALSAFDLKRPSLMFGRIKVGDKVQVKFDLVLKS